MTKGNFSSLHEGEVQVRKARRAQRPADGYAMREADRKLRLTLRLPPQVVAYFRKTGPGWQIGETLARHVRVIERHHVTAFAASNQLLAAP